MMAEIINIIVGVTLALFAGLTYWLSRKQSKILKQQSDIVAQQTLLIQNQFRLSLFEKGMPIIGDILSFIVKVTNKRGDISQEESMEFNNRKEEARYLFGEDVYNFMKEILDNQYKYCMATEVTKTNPNDKNALQEARKLRGWFLEQYGFVLPIFEKYLKIDEGNNG